MSEPVRHERGALRLVVLARVEDVRLRTAGLREVARVAALDDLAVVDRRDELVLQADVRERAADHDLMVAAARAIGVEVLLADAVLLEVLRRRGAEIPVGDDEILHSAASFTGWKSSGKCVSADITG